MEDSIMELTNIGLQGTAINNIEVQQKILNWSVQLLRLLNNKYTKIFKQENVTVNQLGVQATDYITEALLSFSKIDVNDVGTTGEIFNLLKETEDDLASAVTLMYQLTKGVTPSSDILYKSGGTFSLAVSTTTAVSSPMLISIKRIITLTDILFGLLIAYTSEDTDIYKLIERLAKQVTVLDSTSQSFDLLVKVIVAYIKIGAYLALVNKDNKNEMYTEIENILNNLQPVDR